MCPDSISLTASIELVAVSVQKLSLLPSPRHDGVHVLPRNYSPVLYAPSPSFRWICSAVMCAHQDIIGSGWYLNSGTFWSLQEEKAANLKMSSEASEPDLSWDSKTLRSNHVPLPDSENTSAKSHGYAHDNAFANSIDLILTASVRSVEEMFWSLLKRSQHQHTAFHLGNAVSSDAKNFTLLRASACTLVLKDTRQMEDAIIEKWKT